MSRIDLRYLIDAKSKIISFDSQCDVACERGKLGGDFFDTISDANLRHVFRLIFDRVRTDRREICLTLRCDTPALRRDAYVRIRPFDGDQEGMLEIENGTLAETPRPPVALLEADTRRGESFVTICSWCKQVKVGDDEWVEIEEAVQRLHLFGQPVLPRLTHGMCPTCYQRLTAMAAGPSVQRQPPSMDASRAPKNAQGRSTTPPGSDA